MAALRPLARIALVLLCALPAAALATGESPAALTIESGADTTMVTLTCADPTPSLALAIDEAPATPLAHEALGAAPSSVALVIDTSAAMAASGTPYSTRLRDAVTQADLLLALAPPGTAMALITFDRSAQVSVPMSEGRSAIRAALADLRAAPTAPSPAAPTTPSPAAPTTPPDGLPGAIRLGLEQLRGAAPGPHALVAFVAEAPELGPMDAAVTPGVAMLVVGHGGGSPPGVGHGGGPPPGAEAGPEPTRFAEQPGAAYVPYYSADIAELPALNTALERRFARLLAPGVRLRLRLPTAGLAPGAHLLSVKGCDEPKAAAFVIAQGLSPSTLGVGVALALAAAAAGAAVSARRYRKRAPQRAAPPSDTATARLRAAATITTARRSAISVVVPRLRAVIWEGRRRRQLPLEGRQWTIGSDPACALCVEGEGVAPLHARVSLAGGRLEITALDGGGRTSVGRAGRPLAPGAPAPLEPGELVTLGQSSRLMIEADVDPVSGEG